MATGGRVERALVDRLATDHLVHMLCLEVEQLRVARRYDVPELVLHVKLGHREHCV